jgi:type VI secretion system protein ImpC
MPYKPSFGTIQSVGGPTEPPKPESPFRIAVLADFSGRQNRGETGSSKEIAARRLLPVSRDTLDDVMANLGVRLKLPVGEDGDTVTLSFASQDDFHPDQIHDRVEQIADLYESDEKSALMNGVLHHSDFQALESAWRGLHWLLGRAAKGGQVEVMFLDLSLAELAADLKASENLTASGLHQLLIEKGVRGPRGEPWAVLVGNYVFDLSGPHAELLGRLAKIASQTNAPFLSTVHPQVLDKSFTLSPDAAPAWQALRQLPEAALLGLAVPRFLLRLPYGENTQSIDKFSYEEMSRPPDRGHYLWGNPALGCAALIAQAFHKEGWGCKPGAVLDLQNLPIHVYTMDDEEEVTLAEAWLVQPKTEQLVKQGIMPLLCVRGQGAMQLSRFLSLAQPPKDQPARELQGRWSRAGMAPAPRTSAPPAAKVGLVGEVPPAPRPTRAAPAPAAPAVSAPEEEEVPETEEEETPEAEADMAPEPQADMAPEPEEAVAPEPEEAVAPEPEEAVAPEPVTEVAPEAAELSPPPAEEEMDPDLAALLKQLE